MSAAGDLAWRPLPLAPSPGLPVLLVSAEMGPASYTIRVTDMANMWAESLDRKAVCLRGWSENTSIDPSDTPENMARFLASLKSALDSSQPGHGETSLGLSPAAAADAGDDGLTLRVTCALAGLAPLKWPVHLSKSPPSAIATDLVLPLVQAQYAKKRQVESLLQALRHKDAVLTKLSDKLEAMGTGLEHVFTALSGRRKVTRSIADDRVKGLAPFDERKWQQHLDREMDGPDNTSRLVQSVFGGSGLQHGNMMAIDRSPALDGWWHNLKGGPPLSHPEQQTRPAPWPRRTPSPPADAASDEDGDFQVQATPPHLKSAGTGEAARDVPPLDDASTTGDEEEEDSSAVRESIQPAAAAPEPPRRPEPTRAASRPGAIGGKKQTAARRSPVAEAKGPGKEKAELPADDSETASEAPDDDATASVPGSPPRPPPEPAPTTTGLKKGGLGKIGGGAPKALGENMPKSPGAGDAGETDGAPAHKKLGVIGNRIGRGASPPGPAQGGEDKGRGRTWTTRAEGDAAEREPRETSQERADRRRQELKRDLERKAAAGPTKKKRRF